MSFNETMKEAKENNWKVDVQPVEGRKYRGKLKWWSNYEICLGFGNDAEYIFFKANLIFATPVKD